MVEWLMARFITNLSLGAASLGIFFLLILVHECGHYIAARLAGVRVEKFVIGLGKEIWHRADRSGTIWSIRMLPLYGYVGLARAGRLPARSKTFEAQPLWKRMAVVAAGPAASFLLAFFLLFSFFITFGRPVTPAVVTGVVVDSPADLAGMRPGDRIREINGEPVRHAGDVSNILFGDFRAPVSFLLSRSGDRVEVTALPGIFSGQDEDRIGFLMTHTPVVITDISSVNGEPASRDEGQTRALLAESVGNEVVLGMGQGGSNTRKLKVFLDPAMNGHLEQAGENLPFLYLGQARGNIFLSLPPADSLKWALHDTARLVLALVSWAKNIWTADGARIRPSDSPSAEQSPFLYHLYIYVYITALMSLALGLITLLPFPRLDGHYLVRLGVEVLVGPRHAEKTAIYVTAFLSLFIAGWLLASNVTAAVASIY